MSKGIVYKAEQLTFSIFAHFKLQGLAAHRNAKSYINYQDLEALAKTVRVLQVGYYPRWITGRR
jgi:hypothetical protein